jgi:hypothetical protein
MLALLWSFRSGDQKFVDCQYKRRISVIVRVYDLSTGPLASWVNNCENQYMRTNLSGIVQSSLLPVCLVPKLHYFQTLSSQTIALQTRHTLNEWFTNF